MAFFAIIVPFVANTTVLDRQRPAGLREALRSSRESVHATIPNSFMQIVLPFEQHLHKIRSIIYDEIGIVYRALVHRENVTLRLCGIEQQERHLRG